MTERVRGGAGSTRAGTAERDPSRNEKVIEENPPNLQILGWLLNSAYMREDPRLSVRDSSWKAERSKRLLPAGAEKEFGVRVQQVNYLQEKKNSSEEVNRILRIYNLHHKHPAYIKNHVTCKETRNVRHSQEEEQSKETDPQDNQAPGISRREI